MKETGGGIPPHGSDAPLFSCAEHNQHDCAGRCGSKVVDVFEIARRGSEEVPAFLKVFDFLRLSILRFHYNLLRVFSFCAIMFSFVWVLWYTGISGWRCSEDGFSGGRRKVTRREGCI
jgi:hypothetical protein